MASDQGFPVQLYVYDLTHGLASALSPALIGEEKSLLIGDPQDAEKQLGQQVEGVWHTSLVVYEREYFYGGNGISCCAPGSTQLGPPQSVERLGETFVPYAVFVDYLDGLAATNYRPSDYRLLEHNCNHFTDEVAQFLCGARVPKHIVLQPALLPPPLRLALQSVLDSLAPQPQGSPAIGGVRRDFRGESPEYLTLNHQIEEARAAARARFTAPATPGAGPARAGLRRRVCRGAADVAHCAARVLLLARCTLQHLFHAAQSAALEARRVTLAEKLARKERRKEKKRKKHARDDRTPLDTEWSMAEAVEAAVAPAPARAGPSAADDEDARDAAEQRRRQLDPPILYTDINGEAEYESLVKEIQGLELTPEEKQSLEELQQYLVRGEGSWVLGDEFLAFLERLLAEETSIRVAALRCLAAMALREDVSLVLHQDRRRHALMSHAARIDRLPPPEQQALALVMCNLFAHPGAAEWLLYISEWPAAQGGAPLSNIRATTKVCVHATLSEEGALREVGTALMHNMATREVKTVRLRATRPLRDLLPRHAKAKVFDEVCAELSMALLQLLTQALEEEQLFRCVKALARLCAGGADVPQLVAMVGPAPTAFRGASPRVDEQIDLIMQKVKM